MKSKFSFILLPFLLGLLGVAFAQVTPTPDTATITNTATATYTNAANQALTATSNTVTTDVLPIYRFAITPNGTNADPPGTTNDLNGTVGESVVFTYNLENQGNTTSNTIDLTIAQSTSDQFDFGAATVYLDDPVNGIPGQLDPADTIVKAPGATTGSVTVPYGESVTLFVEAAIPTGTTTNTVGRLNLEGNSRIGGESDTDNWAQATVFTNAVLSLAKTASETNVIPGDTITYTLSGSNTGGSSPFPVENVATIDGTLADGILITDAFPAGLPNGLIYTPGTLESPNTTGTRQLLYSVNGGTTWTTTEPDPDPDNPINAVALFIPGTAGTRINPADPPEPAFDYGFTFDVTVPAGARVNTSYNNTGTLNYDIDGDGTATDTGDPTTDEVVTSNTTTTTVDASGNFVVGPFEDADASGDVAATYTLDGFTVTRAADTQTIATVPNGRDIRFEQSLFNGANFDDTYTFDTTLPVGFTGSVTYTRLDGTPITAANPLAVPAGTTAEFYTVITLPGDFTSATALDFETTATASVNTTATDTTTNTLGAVIEAQAVNIGNNDLVDSTTPNDTPVIITTPSGETVLFPLVVANGGVDPDIYDLTTTSDFAVTLYSDANCDGVIDAGTDVVVTDTGTIPAGGSVCLIASVVVPAGATATSYPVTVTATSQTDSTITDSITNTVTVELEGTFTFDADEAQTTPAGTTITYQHLITNSQNDAVTVDITVTEPGTPGWIYEYSLTGAPGSFNSTLPAGFTVPAGETQDVYVQVTVPAGVANNVTDDFTLTATPSRGTPDTITDTTRVNANPTGTLELAKTVSDDDETAVTANSAVPGETLTYTIVGTNTGGASVTNVKITDSAPTDTTFVSVSATASFTGDILYSSSGADGSWSTTPTTTSTFYVGVDTSGDGDITAADVVPEDGFITVTFAVTIN